MKDFNEIINELNKENKIPDDVDNKINETLNMLEESRTVRGFSWAKYASAAAVAVLSVSVFCVTNPTLAANFPVIGSIIKLIENKTEYPGNYSKMEQIDNSKSGTLSAEDSGIKITASEVYSDGYSIFITMQMESNDYDFNNIPKMEGNEGQYIAMETSYGINKDVDDLDHNITLQGANNGKHTFVGMAKFDKSEYSIEEGMVNIKIKGIYLDGDENEKITKGKWNLSIPYTTDTEEGREITANKKINNTITIDKVFVSKYQLVIFSDVSYKEPYKNCSDSKILEQFGEKANVAGFDEIRNRKDYDYYEIAVFDQDGHKLNFIEMGYNDKKLKTDLFSIANKDLSKVNIYVCTDENRMFELIKATNENEAKKIANGYFSIDVK